MFCLGRICLCLWNIGIEDEGGIEGRPLEGFGPLPKLNLLLNLKNQILTCSLNIIAKITKIIKRINNIHKSQLVVDVVAEQQTSPELQA